MLARRPEEVLNATRALRTGLDVVRSHTQRRPTRRGRNRGKGYGFVFCFHKAGESQRLRERSHTWYASRIRLDGWGLARVPMLVPVPVPVPAAGTG